MLEVLPQVLAALQPLVGQKIINVGGALSERAKSKLPTFDNGNYPQVFVRGSMYSLRLEIKSCVGYGEFSCTYQEASAHLGTIDGLKLADLTSGHEFRTNYTVQEVLEARERLKKADAAKRQAESDLMFFGEYDR